MHTYAAEVTYLLFDWLCLPFSSGFFYYSRFFMFEVAWRSSLAWCCVPAGSLCNRPIYFVLSPHEIRLVRNQGNLQSKKQVQHCKGPIRPH